MMPDAVRQDEKVLLDRVRELLAKPRPDHTDLWQVSGHIGALTYYVTELAAALEKRREAELPEPR